MIEMILDRMATDWFERAIENANESAFWGPIGWRFSRQDRLPPGNKRVETTLSHFKPDGY
jgi:hypothetical protein